MFSCMHHHSRTLPFLTKIKKTAPQATHNESQISAHRRKTRGNECFAPPLLSAPRREYLQVASNAHQQSSSDATRRATPQLHIYRALKKRKNRRAKKPNTLAGQNCDALLGCATADMYNDLLRMKSLCAVALRCCCLTLTQALATAV